MSETKKVIDNTAIMESKKRIVDTINNEINTIGIPVSIVSMILHGCASEVDFLLNQTIAAEKSNKENKK